MKTPQQGNEDYTYLPYTNKGEINTEKENMCGKTKGYNIAGKKREQVDLHINNKTINNSF